METSRDDFIIAIRSAFLQKGAAQRFSLLALIILSIILLSLEFYKAKPLNIFRNISKDIIYRGSYVISLPFKSLDRGYKTIKIHFSFYEDYKNLKKELSILKSQNQKSEIEFLRMQNRELKTVIAEDDPQIETFKELDKNMLIQLVILPAVGCEKFAEYIYNKINPIVTIKTNNRVRLMSVEVREHGANSAIYMGDK